MNEEISLNLTPAMMTLVPIVAVILQMLKRIEQVEPYKEFLPLLAMAVAVGLGYLTKIPNPIFAGVIMGLVAAGGYDVFKLGEKKLKKAA